MRVEQAAHKKVPGQFSEERAGVALAACTLFDARCAGWTSSIGFGAPKTIATADTSEVCTD
jgi:hypothetical protein